MSKTLLPFLFPLDQIRRSGINIMNPSDYLSMTSASTRYNTESGEAMFFMSDGLNDDDGSGGAGVSSSNDDDGLLPASDNETVEISGFADDEPLIVA